MVRASFCPSWDVLALIPLLGQRRKARQRLLLLGSTLLVARGRFALRRRLGGLFGINHNHSPFGSGHRLEYTFIHDKKGDRESVDEQKLMAPM